MNTATAHQSIWTKAVCYAYPSSPIAKRYGFAATGCYYAAALSTCSNGDPREVIVAVRATKEEARIEARDNIHNAEWSRYSL